MTAESPQDHTWDSARRVLGDGILSIIMPVHNLGHSIAANIEHVRSLFSGHLRFETIVVDDGSNDNTRGELERIAPLVPDLRPVYMSRNMGKGEALRNGFQSSRGTYVLLLDGDLDLPPAQTSRFFEIMEKEAADIVIGSKRHPGSRLRYPWHRKLASAVYYGLVKILIGLPVKDTQTGIKLFRREALDYVMKRMLIKQFAFDLEILAIANERGFKITEAPVEVHFQGTLGCLRPSSVKQVMNDTLAVFYRLRILRYYQTIRETVMPFPAPLVSIVIAYPAPTAYLDECLEAIYRQDYSDYEIILLPDEPSHRKWPERVREIPTGRLRPAEKRNIGIERARGTITAFLDDDTFPVEDWLYNAVVYFGEKTIAAVGGPASTAWNDSYMAGLSGQVYSNRLVSGQYRYRYEPNHVREVEDYPSCNLLVRTDVLKKLGGFRSDFWPGEDTLLCRDIVKDMNMKIIYDPRVHVYHHRRALFLPHLRQIGRYALHRGCFARRFPETSRKLSYMLPSLFVLGLATGGISAFLYPPLRLPYVAALIFYAALTLVSCVQRNPLSWILTWTGLMLTHVVYGVRFLAGLLFCPLPKDVQPFDHGSEGGIGRNGVTECGRMGEGRTDNR